MLINIISQMNFLDILLLIIALRICYTAAKTGLAIEFFKLLGVLFATYVALHYYTSISDLIQRRFVPKELMPLEFFDFIVFFILAWAAYLGFVALRSIFYRFMSLEATPKLNKFGGLILGIGRAFLSVGLLVYMLTISSVSYLSNSVKHSYLGRKSVIISPVTYHWLWSSVVAKFSKHEKFNPIVSEIMGQEKRK